jgi:V8-like Glu-specific endopeptidase
MKILLIILSIICVSCSVIDRIPQSESKGQYPDDTDRIYDFEKVIYRGSRLTKNSQSWKSVVKIDLKDKGNGKYYSCTAIIIAKNALLTSAHCMYKSSRNAYRYLTGIKYYEGSDYKSYTSIKKGGSKSFVHPQYFSNTNSESFDIAVIMVPAGFKSKYIPVTWSNGQYFKYWTDLVGKTIYTVGASSHGTGTLSCARGKIYRSGYEGVRSSGISFKQGVCYGDSGGANFVYFNKKLIFIGIHSRSWEKNVVDGNCNYKNRAATPFKPKFRDWVRDILARYTSA